MLVLVPTMLESCFGRFILKSTTFVACAVLSIAPAFCLAQTHPAQENNPSGAFQKSVLVQTGDDDSNPAAANSVASVAQGPGGVSGTAGFSTHVLSPAPKAPEDLLMPASPTEDTFTRPVINELRAEGVEPKAEFGGGGSAAIGTPATTNQSRQEQQQGLEGGQTYALGTQNQNSQRSFQQPVESGNSFGRTSNSGNFPPIRSGPEVSSTPTSSGVNQSATQQVSDWRDAPPEAGTAQLNNAAATGSGQQSFGTGNTQHNSSQNTPLISGAMQPINSSNSDVQNEYIQPPSNQGFNRDNEVRPTGFNQPIQPKTTTKLAKSLIARYAVDNFSGALPGEPIKLVDMLRQPLSTQQRRPMVNQFWETYYDWASLVAAQQYEQWLKQIPGSLPSSDKAMLDAARVVANNKVLAAEIQLGKSQSGLVQFMPNRRSELLPLPNDLPLIQNYQTNYELYKSYRMMPASLLGIDQMLPQTLELIKLRAEAVRVAKRAADQMVDSLRNRQSTIASTLATGQMWRAAEQDLVASVTSYNQAIADYALTVYQGDHSPEKIVAMLIAKPTSNVNTQPSFRDSVRQQPSQPNIGGGQPTRQQTQIGQRDQFGRPIQRPSSQQPSSQFKNQARNQQSTGQSQQVTNGNSAGSFKLNAKNAFQGNGQNRSNNTGVGGQGKSQTTNGSFIAPPTNVGNSSFGQPQTNSGNNFSGPQLPSQQFGNQGSSARSAQTQFGPNAKGFGR